MMYHSQHESCVWTYLSNLLPYPLRLSIYTNSPSYQTSIFIHILFSPTYQTTTHPHHSHSSTHSNSYNSRYVLFARRSPCWQMTNLDITHPATITVDWITDCQGWKTKLPPTDFPLRFYWGPRSYAFGHLRWFRGGDISMKVTDASGVQHIHVSLSSYFIPFSSSPSLLSIILAHPSRGFFTIFVDFPPHPRVTGSTSMCKDPWMGGLHKSRATAPTSSWADSRSSPSAKFPTITRACRDQSPPWIPVMLHRIPK